MNEYLKKIAAALGVTVVRAGGMARRTRRRRPMPSSPSSEKIQAAQTAAQAEKGRGVGAAEAPRLRDRRGSRRQDRGHGACGRRTGRPRSEDREDRGPNKAVAKAFADGKLVEARSANGPLKLAEKDLGGVQRLRGQRAPKVVPGASWTQKDLGNPPKGPPMTPRASPDEQMTVFKRLNLTG